MLFFSFFHNEEEATWKAISVFCKFIIILLYCSLDPSFPCLPAPWRLPSSVCVQAVEAVHGASLAGEGA